MTCRHYEPYAVDSGWADDEVCSGDEKHVGSYAREYLCIFACSKLVGGKTTYICPTLFDHRLWFLRPTRNIAVLTARQDAIGYLAQQCNIELLKAFKDCLKNISNVPVCEVFRQWSVKWQIFDHVLLCSLLERGGRRLFHDSEHLVGFFCSLAYPPLLHP